MLHMTNNEEDNIIIEKIYRLKKRVPFWANTLSAKLGVKPRTIRAWSTGDRGITKGYHLTILEELIILDQQRSDKIKKLTA
jgi:hypothetical protein